MNPITRLQGVYRRRKFERGVEATSNEEQFHPYILGFCEPHNKEQNRAASTAGKIS